MGYTLGGPSLIGKKQMYNRTTRRTLILALLAGLAVPAAAIVAPDGSMFGAAALAKDGESGGGGGDSSGHGGGGDSSGHGGGGDNSGGGDDHAGHGSGDDGSGSGKGKRDGREGRGSVKRYLDLLKDRGQVAQISGAGSKIEVRYTDGWRETISGNRYRLYDDKSRRVMDRPARSDDYERLRAARR